VHQMRAVNQPANQNCESYCVKSKGHGQPFLESAGSFLLVD
jgi:hypothetical protein